MYAFADYKPFHNIFCNGCGKDPIYGNRYKCQKCYDLHLCEQCYTNNKFGKKYENEHNENHAMKLFMSQLDEKSTYHHEIICNGCNTEKYPGKRYCCNICQNYNLCQRCFDDNRYTSNEGIVVNHNNKHEMTVFDFEGKNI
uniref:ZZ-type domain-containing protein n=1 Tax=Panagrolaimus davidi TaxID=227884 RepID=A0A914Q3S2_9BILA